MSDGAGLPRIVCGMRIPCSAGFTLTEVVVALLVASAAGVVLTTTLLAEQRLRLIADAEREGARAAREQLEVFAARPCGADSAGVRRGGWGDVRWSARATDGAWTLVDSLRPQRAQAVHEGPGPIRGAG